MPSEKNLLASFTLFEQAEACQTELRRQGFDVVQIDDIPSLNQTLPHTPMVEWGRHSYEPDMLDDKWTAASAWDNPEGLIYGEGWLLTAVVPSEKSHEAARIIEQHGGKL